MVSSAPTIFSAIVASVSAWFSATCVAMPFAEQLLDAREVATLVGEVGGRAGVLLLQFGRLDLRDHLRRLRPGRPCRPKSSSDNRRPWRRSSSSRPERTSPSSLIVRSVGLAVALTISMRGPALGDRGARFAHRADLETSGFVDVVDACRRQRDRSDARRRRTRPAATSSLIVHEQGSPVDAPAASRAKR